MDTRERRRGGALALGRRRNVTQASLARSTRRRSSPLRQGPPRSRSLEEQGSRSLDLGKIVLEPRRGGRAEPAQSSLAAARQFQHGQSQLRTAVMDTAKTAGRGALLWGAYEKQMQSVVTAQSNLSAYSRGDLEGALTALTQTTGSASKGLSAPGADHQPGARQAHGPRKAASLVGKVADGNTASSSATASCSTRAPRPRRRWLRISQVRRRRQDLRRLLGGRRGEVPQRAAAASDHRRHALLPVINRLMGYLNTGLGLFQRLPGPVKSVVVALARPCRRRGHHGAVRLRHPRRDQGHAARPARRQAWTGVQWLLNAAMTPTPSASSSWRSPRSSRLRHRLQAARRPSATSCSAPGRRSRPRRVTVFNCARDLLQALGAARACRPHRRPGAGHAVGGQPLERRSGPPPRTPSAPW